MNRNNQKGSTLLFISMMISFLMVMALAVAQVILVETKLSSDIASSQKAFYGKKSAFEIGLLGRNNISSTIPNSTQISSVITNPFGRSYIFDSRGYSSTVRREDSYFYTKPVVSGCISHSLALKSDGTVWAWGSNGYGQLGNNTTTSSNIPISVPSLSGFKMVSGGDSFSLALKSDGTVWAWGWNQYGNLGDGTGGLLSSRSLVPVQSSISRVNYISAGMYHSLAVKIDGTVWAWGNNGYGQLGNNASGVNFNPNPIQVRGYNNSGFLTGILKVDASNWHSIALKSDGTIWSWGYNSTQYRLGDNTTTNRLTPVRTLNASSTSNITTFFTHNLSINNTGSVYSWGYNLSGALGNSATSRTTATIIPTLSNVVAISAGRDHSLAIKSDGTVWAWGENGSYQLGDGTTSDRAAPIQVHGFNNTGFLKI